MGIEVEKRQWAGLQDDFDLIYRDIESLPVFVKSGGVAAIGDEAFSVLIAPESSPIIAASRYGEGRVVLLGNASYFDLTGSNTVCSTLARNLLLWLTEDKGNYQGALEGGKYLLLATAVETLTVDPALPIEIMPFQDWSSADLDPSRYPVLNVDASIDAAAIPVLASYVHCGGAIIVAQKGWQLCASPAEAFSARAVGRPTKLGDHPLQQLLYEFGLLMLDSVAQWYVRPTDKLPKLAADQAIHTHAMQLWEQMAAIESGMLTFEQLEIGRSDASVEDKVRVMTAIVDGVVRALPNEAPLLRTIQAEAAVIEPATLPLDRAKLPYTATILSYAFQHVTLDPDNVKSPYADVFPRAVREDASIVNDQVIDVNFDYLDLSYMRMLSAPENWHSTGLYAPAGSVITIVVPEDAGYLHFDAQIGIHTDHLCDLPVWDRVPVVALKERLHPGVNRLNSPYGGLIYLIPRKSEAGVRLQVTIHGAVRAPYFVLGQTTDQEWHETIKHYPAPWAELQGKRIIVTVPTADVLALTHPEQLMAKWDEIAERYDALVGVGHDLDMPHRSPDNPQRLVADIQISAGWMHSGYPIMFFEGVTSREAVDVNVIQTNAWGFWHELGHNYQQIPWFWEPIVEVSVNLHSLHIQIAYGNRSRLFELDKNGKNYYEKAMAFVNSDDPGKNFEDTGYFERLVMIKQLQMAFGWGFYTNLHIAYRELPREQVSMDEDEDEQQKIDLFVVMASQVSGCDLVEFFEHWGIPMTDEARRKVAELRLAPPADPIWTWTEQS
ncbi:M60 family metallopeptidase [Paenibacillus guangzhouensis]|uniref:M60 family metallopeptidase n=1 Tax=Paenibacillus guangzhouensis TaxID=1473112 RepID=UPI001266AA29|nr:M60 family metallopeptidase [Paenibacillus guangzhouensis]